MPAVKTMATMIWSPHGSLVDRPRFGGYRGGGEHDLTNSRTLMRRCKGSCSSDIGCRRLSSLCVHDTKRSCATRPSLSAGAFP
jgi:hypothetical protein